MGKGKWDRQRVKRHSEERREGRREEKKREFHFTGKQCHLLILVRVDAGRCLKKKKNSHRQPRARTCSSPSRCGDIFRRGKRGRGITLVSYNGRNGAESRTWLIGTESTPSLTLIDQPLSKAKARVGGRAVGGGGCNKHSRSVDLEQTLQRTD